MAAAHLARLAEEMPAVALASPYRAFAGFSRIAATSFSIDAMTII
jgi:hypothetical protein